MTQPLLRSLLVLIAFFTCMSTEAARPAVSSPVEDIRRFYMGYLNMNPSRPAPPNQAPGVRLFSKVLRDLIQLNKSLCEWKASGEVCGWGSGGDPFLDAQDYDEKLTFARSQFAIRELPAERAGTRLIEVSFNLLPGQPDQANENTRRLQYTMRQEGTRWAIDDISYIERDPAGRRSTVESLRREINELFAQP